MNRQFPVPKPLMTRFSKAGIAVVCISAAAALGALGCAGPAMFSGSLASTCAENPLLVPLANGEFVFDQVVDVVDDYFTIDREQTVQQIDNVITEGRIDTFPEVGTTLLEPWRGDSADAYERLESTLQSI